MACFRCGRFGHYANHCFAKKTVGGKYLSSDSDSEEEEMQPKKRQKTCEKQAGVYVLRTASGLYYVGKSNDIAARIQDHRRGDGAACLHGLAFDVMPDLMTPPGSRILGKERDPAAHENAWNRQSAGWMFTSATLTDQDEQSAFAQICEKFDLC